MPKELATEIANNSEFLIQNSIPRVLKIRHLIFTPGGNNGVEGDYDWISIPLCGDIEGNIVASRKLRNVTCVECLQRMIELSVMDSYANALAHVTSYAPKVFQPDDEAAKREHGGQPTLDAEKHLAARQFLNAKQLMNAADLPKNIIGTNVATYYFNMVELLVINGTTGEPNPETVAEMQEMING